ncbi:MAG TPA: bifunctional 2-polyprenyl-6-hydroxyphenol methylase/3-demethylubiquinol 3-O-methyltransferase UbiG [Candidatus Cybelea sp.]|nr:bifunctional 2-polyprenyl-6-hydroxyphenol methylase/3-demethylubiquinol 3-O-methyltransferase UbiG [Candidatus Cybelea sp.]
MLRKDVRKAAAAATTADPSEIARFNALAEEWWKPDGAFKTVHAFNRARIALLAERLPRLFGRDPRRPRPLDGLAVADIGCAAGLVTEPLSRLGARVIGIDAAERNIRIAQRHADATGAAVEYRHALPEQLVEEGTSFDIVLSLEVVEHVADLPAFLAALARLTRPGGILVIGTLNRTLRSYAAAIVGAEHVLRWLPRGTHDWRRFVRPVELADGLRPHGLIFAERHGVMLNPLTMSWSVHPGTSVAYLQFHRKRALAADCGGLLSLDTFAGSMP